MKRDICLTCRASRIPSSPTADLVFIKKEAEEFYQRGFADTLAANLYSNHDETFHSGLKFVSSTCWALSSHLYFFFSPKPLRIVRALWSTFWLAVANGQETWGCTVMWLHFMSEALPLFTGYESTRVWLPDCWWLLWGCQLSCKATVTLVGWLTVIKTTDVCVCTAVRTNPINPAAFIFTSDAYFL